MVHVSVGMMIHIQELHPYRDGTVTSPYRHDKLQTSRRRNVARALTAHFGRQNVLGLMWFLYRHDDVKLQEPFRRNWRCIFLVSAIQNLKHIWNHNLIITCCIVAV